jgi:hypothetical protein
MLISMRKAKMLLGLLPLLATMGGMPRPHQPVLIIRVAQESAPGVGDFDTHILGFITALQSEGSAADYYMYGNQGPNYGNSAPTLKSKASQIFFVNGGDGIALFVVHNKSNENANNNGGSAEVLFELSGGTASILKDDDQGEADPKTEGGTVFHADMNWAGSNTDGFVVGTLPVGFSITGEFLKEPSGLDNGWCVLSGDGLKIPLALVVGQRVRLDVKLGVDVQQDR